MITYEELSQLESATFLTWAFHYGALSASNHTTIDEALEYLEDMENEGSGATYGIEVFAEGRPPIMIRRSGPKGDPRNTPEWTAAVGPWELEREVQRQADFERAKARRKTITWLVEIDRPDGRGAAIVSMHDSEQGAVDAARQFGDRATVKKRDNR